MKVAVLVGSLRKGSYNRKIANEFVSVAPKLMNFEFIEIGNLPFYNEDSEGENREPPQEWTSFRKKISTFDGVLFFTPEYNRSVPAVLKNAIDVGSRPYGKSIWSKKPCAVISVSVGATGGFGANHHLRQGFVFLDMPCMQQPELYIGNATKLFNEEGKLINEKTKEILKAFAESFEKWVGNFSYSANNKEKIAS